MGIQICSCEEGIIKLPYCDYSLENSKNNKKQQKIINSQLKHNKDSICLPNGNNMNSYYDNKDNHNNQNDLEQLDISLSPITNARKNININIININNESSNNKMNSSSNNIMSGFNNVNIDKIYEQTKHKSNNDPVKEESCEKEESHNQEIEEGSKEEEEEEEEDPKLVEKRKEATEKFDKLIIEFADFIDDNKWNSVQKTVIKKMEENLDDLSTDSNSNKNYFIRPALLFKKDNSIYKGSWNFKGKKEGLGTFIDSKGNKFIGEWKDDKLNGKGRIFSISGDYYEGFFHEGVIEGYGMYYSKTNGYKYMGEFKNWKFHGKGKLIYDDKTTYEGNFFEGYKNGQGKLVFKDGAYYEGNFEKNFFNGKGKFYFKDGRNYNGDWKKNTMDGKGVFNWGNECKYTGDYRNNKREGNGVYSFGCNLYDGNWFNGMPHGEGTLLLDGLRIVGHFRYGKILEMKEGRGVNREMTQKFTMDSKINNKSFDDTNKDKSDCIDSKNMKNFKYASESGSKIEKNMKKNETLSKYSKSKSKSIKKSKPKISKNKTKEKENDKDKEKNKGQDREKKGKNKK